MKQEDEDILMKLLQRHKELGISEQIDFDTFYLYSIITHSTVIEGSTVTEVEAQQLFDEGITSSKRTMGEQMMNLDLKVTYDYGCEWIRKHEPITVWSINRICRRKWSIKPSLAEKMVYIFDFVDDKEEITTKKIVSHFGFNPTIAKCYLRRLTEFGYLEPHGGNKIRTYTKGE